MLSIFPPFKPEDKLSPYHISYQATPNYHGSFVCYVQVRRHKKQPQGTRKPDIHMPGSIR
jgi:hypothetical protein